MNISTLPSHVSWKTAGHLTQVKHLVKKRTRYYSGEDFADQNEPSNLTELEQFCQEEQEQIPGSRCAKLIATCPWRPAAKYWSKGWRLLQPRNICLTIVFTVKKRKNLHLQNGRNVVLNLTVKIPVKSVSIPGCNKENVEKFHGGVSIVRPNCCKLY